MGDRHHLRAEALRMEVASKVNPVTYGVDAIRQVFLGAGPAAEGLGVTVIGHTMSFLEEMAMIGAPGVVAMTAAVWAFGRQE
jgi:ABC-2 type transport system permease protein